LLLGRLIKLFQPVCLWNNLLGWFCLILLWRWRGIIDLLLLDIILIDLRVCNFLRLLLAHIYLETLLRCFDWLGLSRRLIIGLVLSDRNCFLWFDQVHLVKCQATVVVFQSHLALDRSLLLGWLNRLGWRRHNACLR